MSQPDSKTFSLFANQKESIFDKQMSREQALELIKFDNKEKSIEDIEFFACPNTGA